MKLKKQKETLGLKLGLKTRSFRMFLGVSGLFLLVFYVPGVWANEPISINDCLELQLIGNDEAFPLDGNYILTTNIDCGITNPEHQDWDEEGVWGDGKGFSPIGPSDENRFEGSLDGQGFVIADLFIDRPVENNVALVGHGGEGLSIINLGLEDVTIVGSDRTAGLVGRNNNGSLADVYVSGNINSAGISGFLAGDNLGTILRSYANGEFESTGNGVGGLVGENRGTISASYSQVNLVTCGSRCGGVTGQNFAGAEIINSYTTGNVASTGDFVGGFVGRNHGEIRNSYAIGSVFSSGVLARGGFAGRIDVGSMIANSFSTGNVGNGVSDTFNGFVGEGCQAIENSYWHNHTGNPDSGEQEVCEVETTAVNEADHPPYFYTITNGPMSAWDFDIWNPAYSGIDYPILSWQENLYELGEGTVNSPFLIDSCLRLQFMREDLQAHYRLNTNINCAVSADWHGGLGFEPLGDDGVVFSGSFDGQEHTISNLTIERADQDHVGLFGYISEDAEIKKIALENINITGKDKTGGLAGFAAGQIEKSYITGIVAGALCVGGLVGETNLSSDISMVYSMANITAVDSGGGLVGCSGGTVSNSYAKGEVNGLGDTGIGGLVGVATAGSINNVYAIGSVNTEVEEPNIGGLVGANVGEVDIVNSYWDMETSGVTEEDNISGEGTGKNTSGMKNQSTFSGWNFTTIWAIDDEQNSGYPDLRMFGFNPDLPSGSSGSGGGQSLIPVMIITPDLAYYDFYAPGVVVQNTIELNLISDYEFSYFLVSLEPDFNNVEPIPFTDIYDFTWCVDDSCPDKFTIYVKYLNLGGEISWLIQRRVKYDETDVLVQPPVYPSELTPPSQELTTTMGLGSHGEQVKILQEFLNQNNFILAPSGPGSPGEETNFFGRLTRQAVIGFQEHYREYILQPLGLNRGTGFVGSSTLRFIQSIGK